MSGHGHIAHAQRFANGTFRPTCTCGWLGKLTGVKNDAEGETSIHVDDARKGRIPPHVERKRTFVPAKKIGRRR